MDRTDRTDGTYRTPLAERESVPRIRPDPPSLGQRARAIILFDPCGQVLVLGSLLVLLVAAGYGAGLAIARSLAVAAPVCAGIGAGLGFAAWCAAGLWYSSLTVGEG